MIQPSPFLLWLVAGKVFFFGGNGAASRQSASVRDLCIADIRSGRSSIDDDSCERLAGSRTARDRKNPNRVNQYIRPASHELTVAQSSKTPVGNSGVSRQTRKRPQCPRLP